MALLQIDWQFMVATIICLPFCCFQGSPIVLMGMILCILPCRILQSELILLLQETIVGIENVK